MMMYSHRLFSYISVILVFLTPLHAMEIPEIASYSRVSRTGTRTSNSPIISTSRNNSRASEGRSFQASPVYVPSKQTKLHNGEAIDFSPLQSSYSTLDGEMVAKLDGRKSIKQAQDRFHPPAPFEHTIAHTNKLKNQGTITSSSSDDSNFPDSPGPSASMSSESYATLPKHVYPDAYDYQAESKPPKNNLPSITIDDYSPDSYNSKPSNTYTPTEVSYPQPQPPSYLDKYPERPKYSDSFDHSSFDDFPYSHDHDHYGHELIYDHPPEHYHHDYTTMKTTTEEPEMNDQRLSKRPYSYYYIGKKLWYLPLYFSIYFIIYIAALVLKSIARHKINFPANLAEAAGARHLRDHDDTNWWNLTKAVLDGIDKFASDNSVNNNSHS